jgi:uncharacterized protein YndB with AHSA1/START domain
MSVEHRTVRVEREYPHRPSRVFAAWADPDTKRHWFTLDLRPGDEWWMDFRVGGVERYRSPRVSYDGRYCDIVPEERIILTTEVSLGGRRSSVTVNTARGPGRVPRRTRDGGEPGERDQPTAGRPRGVAGPALTAVGTRHGTGHPEY